MYFLFIMAYSKSVATADVDIVDNQANHNSENDTIHVTLILGGGHEYELSLDRESPSLKQLFSVLLEPVEKKRQIVFQFPLPKPMGSTVAREASLCFTGDQLVGVITSPPVYMQPPASDNVPVSSATSDHSNCSPAVSSSPSGKRRVSEGVIPSNFVQLSHFLDTQLSSELLQYVIQQHNKFEPSKTPTEDVNYRQSSVLYQLPTFIDEIQDKIEAALSQVVSSLQLAPFNISQIEAQLTAHNDGSYYTVHNDNGRDDLATRVLTYVYYFFEEPQSFSGGALRLYDSRIQDKYFVQAESFQDVMPVNNSIVFFPSYCMHEVLPVFCPSKRFIHSRFTLNGWIRGSASQD